MQIATVIIPNLNGKSYLRACLDSLRRQSRKDFSVILIDNGSRDDSVAFVRSQYPEIELCCFEKNEGFCRAVNAGIQLAATPYVILLNNDTVCGETFVEEMVAAIEGSGVFSCAAKLVRMDDPDKMDSAGDLYCALGWAYAIGKDRPAQDYDKKRRIFSACGAAAIYRREVFDEIGLFDEAQFAYLEDVDIGYRARIAGYRNLYAPKALVRHAGSATSGSTHNAFKVRYSAQNSVYLFYKNMPWPQMLLNAPFLLIGTAIKFVYFTCKGYFREYIVGIGKGISLCRRDKKVKFRRENLRHYVRIQLELWANMFRRLS